ENFVQGWKPLPISARSAPVRNLTTEVLPVCVLPRSQKTGWGEFSLSFAISAWSCSSLTEGEKRPVIDCHRLPSIARLPDRSEGEGRPLHPSTFHAWCVEVGSAVLSSYTGQFAGGPSILESATRSGGNRRP